MGKCSRHSELCFKHENEEFYGKSVLEPVSMKSLEESADKAIYELQIPVNTKLVAEEHSKPRGWPKGKPRK
jgi:hypothetical protein